MQIDSVDVFHTSTVQTNFSMLNLNYLKMKKSVLIALTFLCILGTQQLPAQSNFTLDQVTYVGALSDNPSEDWTQSWTNIDPQNTAYPDPTDLTTLNGMDAS